jgi:8-oxo-dGTP diphosphatase
MTTKLLADLTTDIVALTGDVDNRHVLLIRRGNAPYQGMWALPGGYVDNGETFEAAARRELLEETGIAAPRLVSVDVYDSPNRDPRGRVISRAYLAQLPERQKPRAGDDAAAAEWIDLDRALTTSLAFDHAAILRDALTLTNHDHHTAELRGDTEDALRSSVVK